MSHSLTAMSLRCVFPGMQRLMRDFKRLQQDPPQGVSGSPKQDNIMTWNALIIGPEDTPWDGGARIGMVLEIKSLHAAKLPNGS